MDIDPQALRAEEKAIKELERRMHWQFSSASTRQGTPNNQARYTETDDDDDDDKNYTPRSRPHTAVIARGADGRFSKGKRVIPSKRKTGRPVKLVDEHTCASTAGILSRSLRALCRILDEHGVLVSRLANKYNRSEKYITKVLNNNAKVLGDYDIIEDDYKYVKESVRRKYPPKESDTEVQCVENPTTQASKAAFESEIKPLEVADMSAPKKYDNKSAHPTLCQYLAGLQPPLSSILPALVAKGLDDAMLRAMLAQQWAPDQQEKVLAMLVETGAMTAVQKVLFEGGMARYQGTRK
ncbi:hypothetical protein HWV62_36460 [Athelia sp. TMB]|nr:hypothetical protein HWV62_36460 [Athelia sp. TMB]